MHADTCPELTDPPGGTVVSDGLTAMYSCEDGLELVELMSEYVKKEYGQKKNQHAQVWLKV